MADIIPLKFIKTVGGAVVAPSEVNPGDIIPGVYIDPEAAANLFGVPYAAVLSGKKLRVIAGTLRQNSSNLTQWAWISDSGHVPVGVGSITASGETLTLAFDQTYGRVISVIAGPDETLAQRGFVVGASVDLGNFALRGSLAASVAGHVKYLGGGTWEHKIAGVLGTQDGPAITASSTGTITVPHAEVLGGTFNYPALTPYSSNADFVPRLPMVRNSSTLNFNAQIFNSTFDGFLDLASFTTRVAFSYRKGFNGPIAFDGTGVGGDLKLYNGNIWVLGLMEVA